MGPRACLEDLDAPTGTRTRPLPARSTVAILTAQRHVRQLRIIFFINHLHFVCFFSKYINFRNGRLFYNYILKGFVRVFGLCT